MRIEPAAGVAKFKLSVRPANVSGLVTNSTACWKRRERHEAVHVQGIAPQPRRLLPVVVVIRHHELRLGYRVLRRQLNQAKTDEAAAINPVVAARRPGADKRADKRLAPAVKRAAIAATPESPSVTPVPARGENFMRRSRCTGSGCERLVAVENFRST
jgi:hypothetical protein